MSEVSMEFNDHYDFRTSFEINDPIINKIFEIDGTVKRYLKSESEIVWEIKLDGLNATSKKFKAVIPYFIRSKKISQKAYPYQKDGILWLLQNTTCVLADDMGLGKTMQCIGALTDMFYNQNCSKALIFCPNNLTKNWLIEISVWGPQFQCIEVTSQGMRNLKDFNKHYHSANILIVPYSICSLFANFVKAEGKEIGVLIADEAHKLRNSSSDLHKSFKTLKSKAIWLLTGTPLERDQDDIRNVLSLLYPEKANVYKSLDTLFLKENLKKVSLRREKKDVLKDLPKVIKKIEWLELATSQAKAYQAILKKMSKAPSDERISFLSLLVQMAAGIKDSKSAKILRAVEIVKDCLATNRKVLIFSDFNGVLESQQTALNSENIPNYLYNGTLTSEQKNKNLYQFRHSNVPAVLLANARSASEGLTLTEASTVIFLNEWWNPSSNRQAEDRVNRIGQTEPVIIYNLRALQTIDTNLAKILEKKSLLEKAFLQELTNDLMKF